MKQRKIQYQMISSMDMGVDGVSRCQNDRERLLDAQHNADYMWGDLYLLCDLLAG